MKWRGGSASYLSEDKRSLPRLEKDAAGSHKLVSTAVSFDSTKKRGQRLAEVRWYLRNMGGKPATGVKQEVILLASDGKEVHRQTWQPNKGTVPAGYAKEQVVKMIDVPVFQAVRISTSTAEDQRVQVDGGARSARPKILKWLKWLMQMAS